MAKAATARQLQSASLASPPEVSAALLTALPAAQPSVSLAGDWRIATSHSAGGADVGLSSLEYDDSTWGTASVPHLGRATVLYDSLWYRCRFDDLLPAAGPEARTLLCFGGAFYQTAAWLNGKLLGQHTGYFQPFAFDITDHLAREDNLLAVRCRFPVEAGALKAKTAVAGIFADWDCKPYPSLLYPTLPPTYVWTVPIGLWGPVSLCRTGPVLIEALNVYPEVVDPTWPARPDEPGAELAHLRIAARLRNLAPQTVEAELSVTVRPHNFEAPLNLRASQAVALAGGTAHAAEFERELAQPRLWFPWTHGEPWLYRADAQLELVGENGEPLTASQTFGVRQVSAEFGEGRWEWRLNGRRIFPKGSNYVADYYLDKVTADGLRRDIDLARAANLDLLRVHAHIAPPEFYRLCDERGMMVQCDFPLIWMYAHGVTAGEAAAFHTSALAQAEDMVALHGSRTSIVLWCAHNELPWTPAGSFIADTASEVAANRELDEAIMARIQAFDETRPVSAASGLFDQHLYHGWYIGGWADNAKLSPAFPTEFGVQALPNPDSPFWAGVNTRWPVPPDDASWAFADYQALFWAGSGVGPPTGFASLAEYIAESQAYQAFYIRHTIDQWRRQKFNPTGGYLQFMLADCWPSITWSVLDYFRLPKAGYAALAEASSPVRLCLELGEGYSIEHTFHLVYSTGGRLPVNLHLVNDDYRLAGRARVEWWIESRTPNKFLSKLYSLAGRLRGGHVEVALPRADEMALRVQSLNLALGRPGRYTLRTQITLNGKRVDENALPFRIGASDGSRRAVRHVPGWMARKFYQPGSLQRLDGGFTLRLRNPAMAAVVQRLVDLRVDGVSLDKSLIRLVTGGVSQPAAAVTGHTPLEVQSGESLTIVVQDRPLATGEHDMEIVVEILGLGEMAARLHDRVG